MSKKYNIEEKLLTQVTAASAKLGNPARELKK